MKKTMRRFFGLLAMITFLMAFTTPNQPTHIDETNYSTATQEPCYMENNTFQVGEELTYKLYYNWNFVWLAAGEVTFKVKEHKGQYHLSAVGKTFKSYEWFFKVRDYYDTYINKESLLPEVSYRDIREGKYRLYDKVIFDQEKGLATSHRGDTKAKTNQKDYTVDACVHDLLSVVYYSRNIDFNQYEKGQEFPVKIFMDKEVWPLKVKYKGKAARKKVKGEGRYNTIKFSPQVISGKVFKEDTEMNVYVTDDQNRIPVLIESPVSVGSVKAVLKEYKGLKYDMTAKAGKRK